MNITVYAETSASSQVTEEIASELHEFRISVRRGQISLDVTWRPRGQVFGGNLGGGCHGVFRGFLENGEVVTEISHEGHRYQFW